MSHTPHIIPVCAREGCRHGEDSHTQYGCAFGRTAGRICPCHAYVAPAERAEGATGKDRLQVEPPPATTGAGRRTNMEITEAIAAKVLETVDAGLCAGVGKPEAGKMCVEAAVCFALGLPHGDNPPCVGASVRAGKIRLNDATWSSDEARAKGLRRVAIAQLGSVDLDQVEYARRLAEKTTRVIVPLALRAAAKRAPKHAKALEAAALRCESEGTRESAINARDVARAAAAAYAAAAAAAYAAYAAAYADNAAAARDHVLGLSAELMTQVLIEMKSPGAAFLFLAPLEVVECV